jgi:hypothetical protein
MQGVLVPLSKELAVPSMAHDCVRDPKWPFFSIVTSVVGILSFLGMVNLK